MVHELLLSTVHNCLCVIITDSRSSRLAPILRGFDIRLSTVRRLLVLYLINGTSAFIKSLRIQGLFHHLGLSALFDHIPIKLIARLLLRYKSSCRCISGAIIDFLTHIVLSVRVGGY